MCILHSHSSTAIGQACQVVKFEECKGRAPCCKRARQGGHDRSMTSVHWPCSATATQTTFREHAGKSASMPCRNGVRQGEHDRGPGISKCDVNVSCGSRAVTHSHHTQACTHTQTLKHGASQAMLWPKATGFGEHEGLYTRRAHGRHASGS